VKVDLSQFSTTGDGAHALLLRGKMGPSSEQGRGLRTLAAGRWATYGCLVLGTMCGSNST
jgi:hypothetical protein